MEIETPYYIAIFIIYSASFFVKGIAGFGDPLILNPSLSMFLENRLISPANLLISAPINAYMAWINRKFFSIKKVIFIAIFLLIGIVPGTLLLKYATSWILKITLGFIVILIGIEMLIRKKDRKDRNNKLIMPFVCFCSGVTSGLYGINLFIIAYIERTSSNRNEFRGNLCFAFAFDNIVRMIAYFASGIMTKDILLLTLLAVPGVIAGLYTGSKIDRKLREETVRFIIISIFIIGGFSIVIKTMIAL
ncbi:MAG: sulfite exporter TauE/SafE family protein [Bacillota bacterium]